MEYREFLGQAGNLKRIKRRGWVQRGLEDCESVASHIFRTVLLARSIPLQENIDRNKLMDLLLVHDLPESHPDVGDITPLDRVPRTEKRRKEEDAMRKLCALIPEGTELKALWEEYEANETPEAQLAHELDIIERILQAQEYQQQHNIDLYSWIQHDLQLIQTVAGQHICHLLHLD